MEVGRGRPLPFLVSFHPLHPLHPPPFHGRHAERNLVAKQNLLVPELLFSAGKSFDHTFSSHQVELSHDIIMGGTAFRILEMCSRLLRQSASTRANYQDIGTDRQC